MLSSTLLVLVVALALIFGVQVIPEPLPTNTGQEKAVLLSSGGFAETPLPETEQSNSILAPVNLAKAPTVLDLTEGGAVVQAAQPIPQPAQPGQIVQSQVNESFQPWDAPLLEFSERVENGQPGQVVGVYVPQILELEVEQQPAADPLFVDGQTGMATQFERAALNGVVGLLAHNTSSGIKFYQVQIGQQIDVIYGNGRIEQFRVQSISEFQKLQTMNPMSDFVDLSTGSTLTSTQVFNRFYSGDHRLTLQTCLERNGDPNWGLHFIEAYPIQ